MIQTVRYRCSCGQLVPSGQRCKCKRCKAKENGHHLYKRRDWRGSDDDPDGGMRGNYLAQNPLCVECEKAGEIVPATEVDHIEPHRGDERLFWDWENLSALCKSCHSRKTRRES